MCGSRLFALFVLVLVLNFGYENEVTASPIPDPCTLVLGHPWRHTTTTTTTAVPPPGDEAESRKEKVKQFESWLEEVLFWKQASNKESEKPTEETKSSSDSLDINKLVAAYIEFLTKFFNMF